jgi:DNA-binding transcriptional MerR regulator
MKTIILLVVSFVSLSLTAQTLTISFQGNNKNRNYQVNVDGVSYYSANSVSTSGKQVTTINNLSAGSHELDVYVLSNNSTTYSDGVSNSNTSDPVYNKIFQLRSGYDMNISVRGNGLVSFTEKRSTKQLTTQTGIPISTTSFNQLVQNIKGKRYQSDKIAAIKSSFATKANYFSTSQVRQLLTLVTAESRRLELAKLSYNKVTDKSNFSSVYDVLNSEASRDALDDYVVNQAGYIENTDNNTAYGVAMADADFSQLLNRTRNYSYQADRIAEVRNAVNSQNYFSLAQIRQLLSLVSSETERLTLAKSAYAKTIDKTNYNQLVNLFYVQANRTELNNFIVNNGGIANNNMYNTAMTDAAFNQVYNKARSHFFQKNTVNEVRTAFNTTTNYFSTEQAKTLLQLVVAEPTRLELAKLAYARVVDAVNFSQVLDLFATQTNKTDLENFINAQQ